MVFYVSMLNDTTFPFSYTNMRSVDILRPKLMRKKKAGQFSSQRFIKCTFVEKSYEVGKHIGTKSAKKH